MMNYRAELSWRSSSFSDKDRYDAWQHELNRVYGSWSVKNFPATKFDSEITHREIQSIAVSNCVSDPCGARRGRAEFLRDEPDRLAVQLLLSGHENFTIGDKQVVLGPGDVLIWNTTKPMDFEVIDRIHKISVMLPLARLRNWLPSSWHTIETTLRSGTTGANLISSFVKSMSSEFLSGSLQNGMALTEAMIGIIVSALDVDDSFKESSTLRDAQIFRIKQFIADNLNNPDLSPTDIAMANRISLRYLHSLFEQEEMTVIQYVIRERLLRCQRELSNPLMSKRTITDIAFSWGFQSSTHFSRRFKDEFGIGPKDFREEAHAGT